MRYYTPRYVERQLAAIQRVLALHYEINGPADDKTCNECAIDEYNYPEWPCNTIKALDGEL